MRSRRTSTEPGGYNKRLDIEGRYSPEVVLSLVCPPGPAELVFHGWRVKMSSPRYHVFKQSCTCVGCGLEGTFFMLRKSADPSAPKDRAHFNLWGEQNGKPVLFTKDHIVPKSRGGTNTLDNYQTMCTFCNEDKGDEVD